MTTAKVAISADFLTAFAHLPRQVQGKVTELVNKFRNDPASPGIHYEKINSCIDKKIYSIRVDDTYRGIVVRQSEVYLLLWVDHHDEAYQWAARKRCEVNPNTGSLQVFDVQTVSEPIAAHSQPLLFSAFKDADLLRLSVPEALLPYVRSFETKEQFYQARSSFPADAYEYLAWLAEGFSMEEVLELANEECNTSPAAQDLSAALEQPITMRSFVVVEGEDELRRIMAAPLEKWRVFLHPAQRNLTQKNYSGPVRVLGGAGTGKTVVALHRAKYLASQCTGQQRILFTTSPQIFRKISARSARSRNYAKLKSFILTHGSAALCASPAFLFRSATMTPWLLYGKRRSFLQTRNCLTTFLFIRKNGIGS